MSRNLAVRRGISAGTTNPTLSLENPFALAPGQSGLTVSSPTILSNWVDRRAPYEMQYELNIQRQMTDTAALELGYNGAEGHHLGRFRNLNVPLPGPGNPQANRPFPALGAIQEVQDYVNSAYNALEIKYTQQMSHGINALVGYTYSRSIDNGSAIRSHGGDADFAQNPYDVKTGERGPSNFNQTHRLTTSLLYEPPIGRGKAFLNKGFASEVLGNWQFNAILALGSGLPFTVSEGANTLNGGGGAAGGGGGRPNYSGASLTPTAGKSFRQWMNPAAFSTPPNYVFGNVPRNGEYGPALLSWDSSMMKMFPVYREQDLQFRFEAFNVPNHPNFGLPNASFNTTVVNGATVPVSTFGRISTTATPMRELQLSLKYIF